jgi:pimeloyl-ACP methyl ester carboxylesterase
MITTLVLAVSCLQPAYLERRAGHRTAVEQIGPNEPRELPPRPPGVDEISYPSNGVMLKAWLISPKSAERRPAVVYLHNDFGLTETSLEAVRPFADAGIVVMLPTYRAENGNPGRFELLYGEVDDARAAIFWFADHPRVDRDRIYVIGHSIGGGIAALLSLYPDLPVRMTASVGGIYRADTFRFWARRMRWLVRFDPRDEEEVSLRLLGPHLSEMRLPHRAYGGVDDEFDLPYARELERDAVKLGAPFVAVAVEGDHMSSIDAAVRDFLALILENLD